MRQTTDFTQGRITVPLLRFAGPVLFALFLQAMYGAVDLMVVGRFAQPKDVSAVSTGSQLMMTLSGMMSSLAMGLTVFLGQKMGEGRSGEGGRIVGTGITFFLTLGLAFSVLVPALAGVLAGVLHAPQEAFADTVRYVRICGAGSLVIIAYNLIGSIFRALGDSRTPLITVMIACAVNIAGDLVLVAVCGMGAAGAAIATVAAQLVSVVLSLILIRRRGLPFPFDKTMLKPQAAVLKRMLALGFPIALQDVLVNVSFLVIAAIVNSLGVIISAGVGVAEKVCAFIMLVPASFMQSMSAFVAQNHGAGKDDRSYAALRSAIAVSLGIGAVMFWVSFFHGDVLAGIFAEDAEVIAAAVPYLKAYAIDTLLTSFLFCFIGFFDGVGMTGFTMVQGVVGAFAIRVPVSFLMARIRPVNLFAIGLATPCSTLLQIALCFAALWVMKHRRKG